MMPSALVGTVLDGKFQIEKPLASGAAGDVYEALHLGLGARVAVKILRPGAPETVEIRRKRFMREARVAARIRSDHVVRVFDIVAPERGPTYIVMELLHGETLAERVRRGGPMSQTDATDYIVQAAKPLGEMHDAGIVHRDVKPSNLFLERDAEGRTRVKLLDFGVAAFQQPVARNECSITMSEAIVGTPRYMAPEQVQSSRRVDARADIWALGVTLYELLVGSPPFEGQTVLAVLNQIETQEPVPLADRRPDLPSGLTALVHTCLAKNPDKRPANARVLGEALLALSPERVGSHDGVAVVASRASFFRSAPRPLSIGPRQTALMVTAGVAAATSILLAAARMPRHGISVPGSEPLRVVTPPAPAITAVDTSDPATGVAPASSSGPRENTTAARRTGEPLRAPTGPAHTTAKPTLRPSPGKGIGRRPPAEDDDRIE